MKRTISAAAFDLDGTLYPNYRFYVRIIPFILKEQRLLRAFGRARTILRRDAAAHRPGEGSFYERQAGVMAEILGEEREKVKQKTETLIYRGWEPVFQGLKLFPQARETLIALKEGGIKLGMLSDFPPERKLAHLGLEGLWDAVLCSETIGSLKPDKAPFISLARSLGTEPGEILYVGNSVNYDIAGAKQAGLQAALIGPRFLPQGKGGADFVFHHYRQLLEYVVR